MCALLPRVAVGAACAVCGAGTRARIFGRRPSVIVAPGESSGRQDQRDMDHSHGCHHLPGLGVMPMVFVVIASCAAACCASRSNSA